MEKENTQITVLTARQILLYLVDFTVGINQVFDRHKMYKKTFRDYWQWREFDRIKFSQNLYRLKTRKIIRVYQEGKDKYLELMPKGADHVRKYLLSEMQVEPPQKWDGKWRIIVFDIPDDKKTERNVFREHLKRMGFVQFQESVFIFPFECKKEINFITTNYYIDPYVKYIVADFFEGDDDLIDHFLKEGILSPKIIKNQMPKAPKDNA